MVVSYWIEYLINFLSFIAGSSICKKKRAKKIIGIIAASYIARQLEGGSQPIGEFIIVAAATIFTVALTCLRLLLSKGW